MVKISTNWMWQSIYYQINSRYLVISDDNEVLLREHIIRKSKQWMKKMKQSVKNGQPLYKNNMP